MTTSHASTSESDSPYNYTPTRYVAFLMIVLFAITTSVHLAQLVKYRMWWLLPTIVFCGLIEILGWSGRLWSTYNLLLDAPYTIQVTATIIAPTPLLAANFVIFGRVIQLLGTQYSRIRPRLYTIIFTSCDVISLVVQGAGGGIASDAETDKVATMGANIILAGIIIQLVIIVVFAALAIEYGIRYYSSREQRNKEAGSQTSIDSMQPTRRTMLMCAALGFSTLLLFIRAVYRVAELAEGWRGPVMSRQVLFNVLDATMVVVAMYTINFGHPGFLLPPTTPSDAEVERIS